MALRLMGWRCKSAVSQLCSAIFVHAVESKGCKYMACCSGAYITQYWV